MLTDYQMLNVEYYSVYLSLDLFLKIISKFIGSNTSALQLYNILNTQHLHQTL